MSCRLISYENPLPGGFQFTDADGHRFNQSPIIEPLAIDVMYYRRANNKGRATYSECVADVDRYNAQRINCSKTYTVQDESPNSISLAPNAPGLAPCATCGAKV